ncbi:hypothetical protein EYF80_051836 [Liparis tanakae]|uniref:Uncharacterized protein n=1 Tax=Liparis tanakae TaxID=230148 RepID=A0A4Z2F9Z1_9TELE|nr:hypothetical protein EYF80_051836 [Liparis tanakae]
MGADQLLPAAGGSGRSRAAPPPDSSPVAGSGASGSSRGCSVSSSTAVFTSAASSAMFYPPPSRDQTRALTRLIIGGRQQRPLVDRGGSAADSRVIPRLPVLLKPAGGVSRCRLLGTPASPQPEAW